MRSWLVHLVLAALMALCAGAAMAGSSAAPLPGQPGLSTALAAEAGQGAPERWAAAISGAVSGAGSSAEQAAVPASERTAPAEPTPLDLPADPAPLDTAADVPALVEGPRPFPQPDLQAAAPRRLLWAPPPLPFLEGLRRPPRSPALQG